MTAYDNRQRTVEFALSTLMDTNDETPTILKIDEAFKLAARMDRFISGRADIDKTEIPSKSDRPRHHQK